MGTGNGVVCEVTGLLWAPQAQHLTYVVIEKNVGGNPDVRMCAYVRAQQCFTERSVSGP